jgi:hypothetical protein
MARLCEVRTRWTMELGRARVKYPSYLCFVVDGTSRRGGAGVGWVRSTVVGLGHSTFTIFIVQCLLREPVSVGASTTRASGIRPRPERDTVRPNPQAQAARAQLTSRML